MKNIDNYIIERFYDNIGGKNVVHAEGILSTILKNMRRYKNRGFFASNNTDKFNGISDVWFVIRDVCSHEIQIYYKKTDEKFFRAYRYYYFELEEIPTVSTCHLLGHIYDCEADRDEYEYRFFDDEDKLMKYINDR